VATAKMLNSLEWNISTNAYWIIVLCYILIEEVFCRNETDLYFSCNTFRFRDIIRIDRNIVDGIQKR
jgi:hypothetical protein